MHGVAQIPHHFITLNCLPIYIKFRFPEKTYCFEGPDSLSFRQGQAQKTGAWSFICFSVATKI